MNSTATLTSFFFSTTHQVSPKEDSSSLSFWSSSLRLSALGTAILLEDAHPLPQDEILEIREDWARFLLQFRSIAIWAHVVSPKGTCKQTGFLSPGSPSPPPCSFPEPPPATSTTLSTDLALSPSTRSKDSPPYHEDRIRRHHTRPYHHHVICLWFLPHVPQVDAKCVQHLRPHHARNVASVLGEEVARYGGSSEDEQPEVQGPGVWVSSERSAIESPIGGEGPHDQAGPRHVQTAHTPLHGELTRLLERFNKFDLNNIDAILTSLKVWINDTINYKERCLDTFKNTTTETGHKM
ncbi:hypothetical protein Fmac_021252 [Flemingia macrophylla]|uniref:Uncharacterized protein n=1 Tax=Flemingia macrophylla TaxID=520843 RepID=A0ABD1LWB5_9FABA